MSTVQPDMKVRYRSDPATAGWVIAVSGRDRQGVHRWDRETCAHRGARTRTGDHRTESGESQGGADAAQARTSGYRPVSVVQGIQDQTAVPPVPAGEEDAGIA